MNTEPADRVWGAFETDAPWVLDRDSIVWLPGVEQLRAAARREVPVLTKPARLPPGRRVVTVVARLAWAIGPWWWRRRRGKYAGPEVGRADISRRLRVAAEALGPSYIKLGQIISSGEGLFPNELVSEFKKCRDQVQPEPFEAVRATIEEDLGRPLHEVFEWIDETALAAASIAQVHAARLRTGEPVVVKVQRPDVARLVRTDLKTMAWIAPHLVGRIPVAALANPPALVELFAETIVEELDFRLEAANMLDIATVLRDLGQDGYVVPRPHPQLVTRRVLVMERLSGFNFDDVAGMQDAGIDTEAVIRTGHGRLHGRRDRARHLPRRPARRQPVRAARRAHGAARLRHRRPPVAGAPARLPPPHARRHHQRRARPAGGAARPRGAAAATPTSTP